MPIVGQKAKRQKVVREWLTNPQNRLSLLLTCFLTLLALLLLLVKNTPEGQRWLTQWHARHTVLQAQARLEQALHHDPPKGTPWASLVREINVSLLDAPFILLIVLGNCEGCGQGVVMGWAETLGRWATWRKEGIKGVLVVQKGVEKVKKMADARGWQVTVIGGEGCKAAKELNVCFVPRAYGFAGGKLVWLQKEPKASVVSILKEFLRSVKGEERAREILDAWSVEMREKVWGKIIANPQRK